MEHKKRWLLPSGIYVAVWWWHILIILLFFLMLDLYILTDRLQLWLRRYCSWMMPPRTASLVKSWRRGQGRSRPRWRWWGYRGGRAWSGPGWRGRGGLGEQPWSFSMLTLRSVFSVAFKNCFFFKCDSSACWTSDLISLYIILVFLVFLLWPARILSLVSDQLIWNLLRCEKKLEFVMSWDKEELYWAMI